MISIQSQIITPLHTDDQNLCFTKHTSGADNPHSGRIAYVLSMWQVSANSYFLQIQNCNIIGVQNENNMTIIEKESITTYAPAKVIDISVHVK